MLEAKREKAYWESLRKRFEAVPAVDLASKEAIRAQVHAAVDARLDEVLAYLKNGQGIAVVLKVEVVNGDRSFRGESSPRDTAQYCKWRTAVYERDGYRCADCGETGKLQAHHVKAWADYPESRFDVDNGRTLCTDCHERYHPHLKVLRKSRAHKAK